MIPQTILQTIYPEGSNLLETPNHCWLKMRHRCVECVECATMQQTRIVMNFFHQFWLRYSKIIMNSWYLHAKVHPAWQIANIYATFWWKKWRGENSTETKLTEWNVCVHRKMFPHAMLSSYWHMRSRSTTNENIVHWHTWLSLYMVCSIHRPQLEMNSLTSMLADKSKFSNFESQMKAKCHWKYEWMYVYVCLFKR